MSCTTILGDCVEKMAELDADSIDAVVCDPPYGLEFMGKTWDRLGGDAPDRSFGSKMQAWHEAWARQALRVLKPGGHLLAFGGARTYHRLACALEDAGFEIRDTIAWMYGSGFPKSKNLDGEWDGWGTAMKPAFEPIVVARKPLVGTVAGNVLAHGTGALNIGGCRIDANGDRRSPAGADGTVHRTTGNTYGEATSGEAFDTTQGRWPANVILSHAEECVLVGTRKVKSNSQPERDGYDPAAQNAYGDGLNDKGSPGHGDGGLETVEAWECADGCPVGMLDEQTGELHMAGNRTPTDRGPVGYGGGWKPDSSRPPDTNRDQGGASRFFYCAKTSRAERNAGLEDFDARRAGSISGGGGLNSTGDHAFARNTHPTVKPIAVMRWLARLVTPPGGTVLDPFLGSGTTGIAARLEGFQFVGIEREPDYMKIAVARIRFWAKHGERALSIAKAARVWSDNGEGIDGQLGLFDS